MFDYYISLGNGCAVASSMSKYGLRAFSAPFDWLITSDLSWVLHYIETDFKDFLLLENIEKYDENPRHFRDKESGFIFLHENYIESECCALKEKYNRRIDRFLKNTKCRVCYLRRMVNEEEIRYIMNHSYYIRKVIKKYNPDNEIVFLCDGTLSVPDCFEFRYYKMHEMWSGASRSALRSYFDHANDFLDYCGENYSGLSQIRNLAVDIDKEKARNALDARKYKTLTTLLTHDFDDNLFSKHTVIYGAGVIGKELYKRIKDRTKVICFVDKEKAGSKFDNIKIISVEELIPQDGIKIIVSVAYDFKNIRNELLSKFFNNDIVSLDDILNLKF